MRMTIGRRARCCLVVVLPFAVLLAALVPAPAGAASSSEHPLVGAYYYLWNPENFAGGTLRSHLVPPQLPADSLVNSQSPHTAARDIANARTAGINFRPLTRDGGQMLDGEQSLYEETRRTSYDQVLENFDEVVSP